MNCHQLTRLLSQETGRVSTSVALVYDAVTLLARSLNGTTEQQRTDVIQVGKGVVEDELDGGGPLGQGLGRWNLKRRWWRIKETVEDPSWSAGQEGLSWWGPLPSPW